MYQALYRKWRPRTFDEIIGQDHITNILKKQASDKKTSHAYLFCGTRGTGKTSSSKVLAKAVNCENPKDGNPCNECYSCRSIDNATATDVLEIDAASNNRVADVRELIDEVAYPPSILKKRVYIIDEVHMLSDSAFNALLKTLEEPPEYVLFILATTELNQLPPTIISRCMRFDFRRIEPDMLAKILREVAKAEKINIDDNAIKLISSLADGAARDALSLLEACSSGKNSNTPLTLEQVQNQLGITNNDIIINLFESIENRNIPEALSVINTVHKSSKDLNVFMVDLIAFARDLLIAKSIPDSENKYLKEHFFFSASVTEKINTLVHSFTTEALLYICSILEESLNSVNRYNTNKKAFFELTIIKLCDASLSEDKKAMLARIAELEKIVFCDNFSAKKVKPVAKKPKIEPIPNPDIPEEKNNSVETPFKAFPELLEQLKDQPEIHSFLNMTEIFEKDNEIIVYSDPLGYNILNQPNSKSVIEKSIKHILKKEFNLIIKEKSGKKQSSSQPIDELNL